MQLIMHRFVPALAAGAVCAALRIVAPAGGNTLIAGLFDISDPRRERLVQQLSVKGYPTPSDPSLETRIHDGSTQSVHTPFLAGHVFDVHEPLMPVCPSVNCAVRAWALNVTYTWEGVIGNTGPALGPNDMYRGLNFIMDMSCALGTCSYAIGYAERENSFGTFLMNDSSAVTAVGHEDYHRQFSLTATDGNIAYFANGGIPAPNSSYYHLPVTFVMGVDLDVNCEHNFTVGGRVECEEGNGQGNCSAMSYFDGCNGHEQMWHSVIDWQHDETTLNGSIASAATGLAVQRAGSYLAVAHAYLNSIHVFDKVTGASLCNASVPQPLSVAFDATEDFLWVVSGTTIVKYAVPADCTTPWPVALTLLPAAVSVPGAIAVGGSSNRLFVIDSGTQQVRVFNGTTGNLLSVIGKAGGYTDGNATVSDDKFMFMPPQSGTAYPNETGSSRASFIAVEDTPEESLWIGDAGNRRVMRVTSQTGEAALGLAYVPVFYKSAVHPDGQRVFANFLEFSVNYSLPINQSWTLVRNWGAGLGPEFNVMDVDYGVMRGEYIQLLELVDGANASQPHAAILQNFTKGMVSLHADGSLRYFLDMQDGSGAAWQEIYTMPMYINSTGSPAWDMPGTLLASFNVSSNSSLGVKARVEAVPLTFPITDDGTIILFDAQRSQNGGDHLAGIAQGGSELLWTAAPWGVWELCMNRSTFQPGNVTINYRWICNAMGQYGGNASGLNYAASYAMVAGSNVIYGFYGEGWNGGETNQFVHHDQSGLFIGQFGALNFWDENMLYALPGAAGNSFSPTLVTVDGVMYLYHNDETAHGGVHRWRIDMSDRVPCDVLTD